MRWIDTVRDNPLVTVLTVEDFARRAFGQVYVATPYTKRAAPDGVFSWQGADQAAWDAANSLADLASLGVTGVSPIVQAHAVVRALVGPLGDESAAALALNADFWVRWCAPVLMASRVVWVPDIVGRFASDGVAGEVAQAIADNKPVFVEGAHV